MNVTEEEKARAERWAQRTAEVKKTRRLVHDVYGVAQSHWPEWLKDGPKTPMELAINLYGGVEKPYRSPKHADRPPKLICKDAGGEGRVRHDLWEMLRDKELVRIKRGLYALPT